MHQSHAVRLAADQTRAEPFEDGVRAIARRLLFSAVGLNAGERQFLHDLARDEVRYPMQAVRRLLVISQKSVRPEDAEAFPELCRGIVLAKRDVGCTLDEAFELETTSQGTTDVAQWRFARQGTAAARAQLQEALGRQLAATRLSLDVLQAHR